MVMVYFFFLVLLVPGLAHAASTAQSLSFVNSISLWVAVGFGALASFLSYYTAARISQANFGLVGKIFSSAVKIFSAGMFLVMLGFFAVVVPPWSTPFVIMRFHDVMFIIGYIVMLFGTRRLWGITNIHK